METEAPIIRASYAKTVLGTSKQRPRAEREAIYERIGQRFRSEIREYGILEWMPASKFAMLVTIVGEVLGPVEA